MSAFGSLNPVMVNSSKLCLAGGWIVRVPVEIIFNIFYIVLK